MTTDFVFDGTKYSKYGKLAMLKTDKSPTDGFELGFDTICCGPSADFGGSGAK